MCLVIWTTGSVGGMFRVQDGLNYYYVVLNRTNGSTRAGVVTNGNGLTTPLSTFFWPGGPAYKTGSTFNISVQMNATGFLIYVRSTAFRIIITAVILRRFPQMDDTLVANVVNRLYVTGGTGFLSTGVGWFDNARLDTLCEGGSQCVGMFTVDSRT